MLKYFNILNKITLSICIILPLATLVYGQKSSLPTTKLPNLALQLDGNDNNPAIGMDIIRKMWTIEAWIKGNDRIWKPKEVIIGAGEYGEISSIDSLPLLIKEGKLYNTKANLYSPQVLDDRWHHIAASCDGSTTKLYLDGQEVASAPIASSILPGVIGTSVNNAHTFGGLIDEVRIWDSALDEKTIKEWSNKSIDAKHQAFKNLKGYYTFDQMQDGVCLNLVGKGHLSFHLRNGRIKFRENAPLATLVPNDNMLFDTSGANQKVFNAVTIQSEWDVDRGTKDNQVLKLRIVVNGNTAPLRLTSLTIDLSKSSRLKDIDKVHLYYTGNAPKTKQKEELFGNGKVPQKKLQFIGHKPLSLKEGINYFLVTFDVSKEAVLGDTLSAVIPAFALNGISYVPEDATANIRKTITENSSSNLNTLKVLQWNIWHGGVHTVNGVDRIAELIAHTNADVITMQEAYGAQQKLAEALSFNLQTPAKNANLAIFSRYLMVQQPSNDQFKSSVAKISLPNQKPLLIANWWLRYAYKYEYTDYYPNPGFNTEDWIKEDLTLNTVDATKNMDRDIDPLLKDKSYAVIIGGDFNSGSHLDWTLRAAPLHYGYGPVALPTSQLMMGRGYIDSFRELNPDELTHQGGTFAVIFGHLQTSRIDFLYHKKDGLKVRSSKIIRTAPDIDDIWPSDHAAVLTVFDTTINKGK
jgi:endonuclease/exonuclease/phosphatase family metal-dependent hydrolase